MSQPLRCRSVVRISRDMGRFQTSKIEGPTPSGSSPIRISAIAPQFYTGSANGQLETKLAISQNRTYGRLRNSLSGQLVIQPSEQPSFIRLKPSSISGSQTWVNAGELPIAPAAPPHLLPDRNTHIRATETFAPESDTSRATGTSASPRRPAQTSRSTGSPAWPSS